MTWEEWTNTVQVGPPGARVRESLDHDPAFLALTGPSERGRSSGVASSS